MEFGSFCKDCIFPFQRQRWTSNECRASQNDEFHVWTVWKKYTKPLIREWSTTTGHWQPLSWFVFQVLISILIKTDFLCLILGFEIFCSKTKIPLWSFHRYILLHVQWNNQYWVKLAESLLSRNIIFSCLLIPILERLFIKRSWKIHGIFNTVAYFLAQTRMVTSHYDEPTWAGLKSKKNGNQSLLT